jgi:glycosyltransferase A (GT-A) superfamily protein (DUF2064 family)
MGSVAVAIFVKTPGLSPLRAQLAESIGKAGAERFYQLSCASLASSLRKVAQDLGPKTSVTPFWAVAELAGMKHPAWKDFSRVHQGDGAMGDRLARVYSDLKGAHDAVLFLNSESPHTSPEVIRDAITTVQVADPKFVLGASEDGSFFLFGGSAPIPQESWTSIPYGDFQTAEALQKQLGKLGHVRRIESTFNVDSAEDLTRLRKLLGSRKELLPDQKTLHDWLKKSSY